MRKTVSIPMRTINMQVNLDTSMFKTPFFNQPILVLSGVCRYIFVSVYEQTNGRKPWTDFMRRESNVLRSITNGPRLFYSTQRGRANAHNDDDNLQWKHHKLSYIGCGFILRII